MRKEIKMPKIIQIIKFEKDFLVCLCEDGSMWNGTLCTNHNGKGNMISWFKILQEREN